MTLVIERVLAIFLIVTGISYGLQNVLWKDLIKELLEKPTWLILWSILFLPLGLIVVIGHNIWVFDWRVIVTILGWLVTLKCVLYLLIPNWANFVRQWSDDFLQRYIQIAGVIEAILGVVLLFLSF
ncbi:MAG TPA: hypothetical protein DCF68_07405 [Cyanothece sp. UBA12306]|nr:hypothetical protein [Cyanothece sp. UBA12306]